MKYILWICGEEQLPTTIVHIEAETFEEAKELAKKAIEKWVKTKEDVFPELSKKKPRAYLVADVGVWL